MPYNTNFIMLHAVSLVCVLLILVVVILAEPQKPEPAHIKLSAGVISKVNDPIAYAKAHPNDQQHALLSNTNHLYKSNKFRYYLNKVNNDRCGNNGCCCCLTEHSRTDGDKYMKDGNGKPINDCQNQRPAIVQMKSGYAVVFCK